MFVCVCISVHKCVFVCVCVRGGGDTCVCLSVLYVLQCAWEWREGEANWLSIISLCYWLQSIKLIHDSNSLNQCLLGEQSDSCSSSSLLSG